MAKRRRAKTGGSRILAGLKIGVIAALAQLGVLLIIIVGYSILFPDKPLPSVRLRAGRMGLETRSSKPLISTRPDIEGSGFHLTTVDGENRLLAGVTLTNPKNEDLGPHHIIFEFTDAQGDRARIVTVDLVDVPAHQPVHVAVDTTWFREDPPVDLEIVTVGADLSEDAVSAGDLVTRIDTATPEGAVRGTVTNETDRMAGRARLHCVTRTGDRVTGGAVQPINPIRGRADESWQIEVPVDFDDISCSVLDEPKELTG